MDKRLVVGALIVDDVARPTRVLAARRTTEPVGKWEFPGGKAEHGESPSAALVREIREELGVLVTVDQRLDPESGDRWHISDSLEMELWWCHSSEQPAPGDSHDAVAWLTAAELTTLDWLEADRMALPGVSESLGAADHPSGAATRT